MTTRSFIDHFGDVVEVPEPRKRLRTSDAADAMAYASSGIRNQPAVEIPVKYIGGPADGRFEAAREIVPVKKVIDMTSMPPCATVLAPNFNMNAPIRTALYKPEKWVDGALVHNFYVHEGISKNDADDAIRAFLVNGPAVELNTMRKF